MTVGIKAAVLTYSKRWVRLETWKVVGRVPSNPSNSAFWALQELSNSSGVRNANGVQAGPVGAGAPFPVGRSGTPHPGRRTQA